MKALKDLFTPTERNGMMPVLLKTPVSLLLFLAGAVLLFSPVYVRERQFAALLEGPLFGRTEVIRLVNTSRTTLGLPSLAENPTLNLVAEDKALDMAGKGYFAHLSPENRSPWDFLRARNYFYSAAGENLATDFVTAREAHDAFMNSPSHRANVLNTLYTEVGAAVVQGNLDGRPTVFIVQYFGKPKAIAAKAQVKPASKPLPAKISPVGVPEKAAFVPTTTPSRETPLVLGTAETTGVPRIVEAFQKFTARYVDGLSPEALLAIPGKVFAVGIVGALLIALFFFVSRMRVFPVRAIFRLLVLVMIFGYIGVRGMGDLMPPKLTPVSYATVGIEARK